MDKTSDPLTVVSPIFWVNLFCCCLIESVNARIRCANRGIGGGVDGMAILQPAVRVSSRIVVLRGMFDVEGDPFDDWKGWVHWVEHSLLHL